MIYNLSSNHRQHWIQELRNVPLILKSFVSFFKCFCPRVFLSSQGLSETTLRKEAVQQV